VKTLTTEITISTTPQRLTKVAKRKKKKKEKKKKRKKKNLFSHPVKDEPIPHPCG